MHEQKIKIAGRSGAGRPLLLLSVEPSRRLALELAGALSSAAEVQLLAFPRIQAENCDGLADELRQLVSEKFRSPALVAIGSATIPALRVAVRNPRLVRSLALVSPVFSLEDSTRGKRLADQAFVHRLRCPVFVGGCSIAARELDDFEGKFLEKRCPNLTAPFYSCRNSSFEGQTEASEATSELISALRQFLTVPARCSRKKTARM